MFKNIVTGIDPDAKQRFDELEHLKKKYLKITENGTKPVVSNSKANFLALLYNQRKYWFQLPLPVTRRD